MDTMGCSWSLLLLVLLAGLLSPASSLYEDQAGKWDWRQRYVGKIKQITSYHLGSSQSIVVATEKNVLASIFVRNGSINWRQVLESRTSEPSADVINAISNGDEYYGLSDVVSRPSSLLTVSGNGRYFRSWEPSNGLLEWEKSLPDDVISDIDEGTNQMLFHVKQSTKQISVAKFYTEPSLKLELHILDAKTGQTKQSQPISTAGWFTDIKDCSFVTSDYLVCVDKKTLTLQLLIVGESKSFVPISLSNFGLKASPSKPTNLKLVLVSTQEEAQPNPVFAIDLGGDGFVVLRIQDRLIKLLKVLPKAKAIAVAPINLPDTGVKAKHGVFVLVSKPEELKRRDGDQLEEFRVAVFDLNTWEELKELNGQFAIETRSPLIVDTLVILPFFKTNAPVNYKILITTSDESIILASSQGKLSWIREESLSSVVSTEVIDLPLSELDASIEQAFGYSSNIATQFLARISSQVYQFQTGLSHLSSMFVDIVAPTSPIKKPSNGEEDEIDFSSFSKSDSSGLVRDYFGLHKIIVVLTRPGKVFGLDTLSGKIVWSFYDPGLGSQLKEMSRKTPIYTQRTTAHFPHEPLSTIVTKSGLIVSFNPVSGAATERLQMPTSVRQVLLMSHADDQFLKGIVTLSADNDQVGVYPSSSIDEFLRHKQSYYLLVGDDKTGLLEGYSFASVTKAVPKASKIWSLAIPLSEHEDHNRVDIIFKRQNEHVHSQGRVLGDRNVLYKYLNPNLAVVVVEGAEGGKGGPPSSDADGVPVLGAKNAKPHLITLYLLDAVTGTVIYTTSHRRSRGPVHLAHTENSIIYSYYNDKSRRTEISSIELYEGYSQANSTGFSSVERPFIRPPVIEHATFIFPTGMVAMVDTQTEKGITNKHLLIALPSGGLLELPKAFLDPRRPLNPTMDHKEEGLIPYIPELPIPSEGIINYNKSLMQVRAIDVAPSGLESTSLVFAYGLDIFYTRVTPSKTFDILKDDFDHLLIAAVLSILIGLAYVSKWLAARKTLKQAWK